MNYKMQFVHHDLGNLQRGQIVEITLSGNAANVQLFDSSNFSNYRNGRRYSYTGGLAKQSPVRLAIPRSGHWHVAVDMRGLKGTVRSSARVLPAPLPTLQERPLASIPSLIDGNPFSENEDFNPEYDVFVSHASEDKDDVVRPLAEALKSTGLKVWYDEFELKIGDSLRKKIDKGLANSKFGIVVLSKDFFGKGWTNYELDGIVSRAVSGEQIILPIWHNITKKELLDFSPSLADKVARSTTTHTIEEIAEEISEMVLHNV
ncbi:MAG: DUF1883 domain-containing protein [Fermentimonas sp.]|nr:DUF1883 domain-containing protein [Fermentimonas sp.]